MKKKRKENRRAWIIIGIIAIALTVLLSYNFFRPVSLSYKKVKAQIGNIVTYYSFSGNVSSKERQSVFSEKMVQISEINIEEGEEVAAGDVLFTTTAGDLIKSKINGEVVLINVEENQQAIPGTLLAEIVNYNNLEVIFKVDEFDVGALNTGKSVTVYIPAIKKEFSGDIHSISKEGQIANGVTFYTAAIDIEQDGNIRIGMSAEVKLISDNADNVVILPMNVIQFDEQNQPYVLKNDSKNSVVKQIITTGINDGTYVEIKSGVLSGEEVLYKNDLDLEAFLFPEGGKNTGFYPKGDKR